MLYFVNKRQLIESSKMRVFSRFLLAKRRARFLPKAQITNIIGQCQQYFDQLVKNHDIEGEIVSQSPVWIRATILV